MRCGSERRFSRFAAARANRQDAAMSADDGFEDIALPGAELRFARAWLMPDEADALFAALQSRIAWERHRIRMFGREVDSPRLSCWIGDPGAVYTYSRVRFEPRPWPLALQPIRQRLRERLGVDFNSVLANLYRDGRDRMGWHSDDEPELGPAPVIASLSLGAARRFVFKPKRRVGEEGLVRGAVHGRSLGLELNHGSLLVMSGQTQARHLHALPATTKPVAARINLTFRRIL
jgi:alkylated DNA repair dioxygenase AlkB